MPLEGNAQVPDAAHLLIPVEHGHACGLAHRFDREVIVESGHNESTGLLFGKISERLEVVHSFGRLDGEYLPEFIDHDGERLLENGPTSSTCCFLDESLQIARNLLVSGESMIQNMFP